MLAKLWYFLRGYVIIRVTGFSVERFINLAAHKGVVFLNIVPNGGTVGDFALMTVSLRDFWLLKVPATKTKCRIAVVKRVGVPFIMRRYRKRKLLAVGALFFVAALYGLSSFIWRIDIEGYERLSAAEITAFLKEAGLEVGAGKLGLDVRQLERQLLAGFSDINWANVEINGTVAIVRITETLPPQEIFDYTAPADIVAKKDALIISVAATSGTPAVKPGDVVSQGDVLVSGMLTVGTPDAVLRTEYVRAEAEVIAKIVYEIEVFVPLEYVERNLSGRVKRFYGVELFGRMFGLRNYNVGYMNFESEISDWQLSLGPNRPVPFIIRTAKYNEVIAQTAQRTEEQAQFHAGELINGRLAAEFGTDVKIEDVRVDFFTQNGYVRARAMVTTIENIALIERR